MAADSRIANAAAKAAVDAVVDLLDAGVSAGYIEIRTGAAPTDVDAAATGTLLATLTCSDPAFGAAADDAPGATATANAITDDSSADATGTAGYYRAYDSAGNPVLQGSAGEAADSTDLTLDNKDINSGQTVQISSWTVSIGES